MSDSARPSTNIAIPVPQSSIRLKLVQRMGGVSPSSSWTLDTGDSFRGTGLQALMNIIASERP